MSNNVFANGSREIESSAGSKNYGQVARSGFFEKHLSGRGDTELINHGCVAIVLGYYNGNKFLPQQIESILNQSYTNLEVFISDDCSDCSVDFEQLRLSPEFEKKVHIAVRASNSGFCFNFLNALACIEGSYPYYAFSDQDDIWYEDKLQNAITVLENYPKNKPALYCARTRVTDEYCKSDLGVSPLFSKPPTFANALVQNIGGGNTMVFNQAARNLIVSSLTGDAVVSHDWWCYQIVSGAGGFVYYDSRPCLKYRQHSMNLVGSNSCWLARFRRAGSLLSGGFKKWNDMNLSALSKNRAILTPENQSRLDNFISGRDSNLLKRLLLFKRTGIYRQTLLGNLALLLSIILKKI